MTKPKPSSNIIFEYTVYIHTLILLRTEAELIVTCQLMALSKQGINIDNLQLSITFVDFIPKPRINLCNL